MLAAALGVVFPKDTPGAKVQTVRIEAAGSGAILVRALPLPEGATCADVKNAIATRCEGYSVGAFELMLGHGGNVLKNDDVIQPTTEPLVLLRRDPYSKNITISDYSNESDESKIFSFPFVIDGKTFMVEATGKEILEGFWYTDREEINPLLLKIYHGGVEVKSFGGFKLFVAMTRFSTEVGNICLVMYQFDFDERIEDKFALKKTVNDGDTRIEIGSFSTNGTINGVPVVLSLPMQQRYCSSDNETNYEEWFLGDVTIVESSGKPHPFTEVFTTESRGDCYFADLDYAIVPHYL